MPSSIKMYKDLFYFDIETTSEYPNFMDMNAEGRNIFTKRLTDPSANIENFYIENAPLLPEFGKIICMSFGVYDTEGVIQIRSVIDDDEEKLIQKIKGVFDRVSKTNKRICGFRIKSFDIPWIVRKMYKYNIDIPLSLNFNGLKPWEILVTDIYDIWKNGSNLGASLEEVTYALGIENPKSTLDGKKIYDYYWNRKDKESIMKYCEGDVKGVMDVAKKLKL